MQQNSCLLATLSCAERVATIPKQALQRPLFRLRVNLLLFYMMPPCSYGPSEWYMLHSIRLRLSICLTLWERNLSAQAVQ